MSGSFLTDRRRLVAGMTGLGLGLGPRAMAADAARPQVEGKTSWSESIMVVYLSDDLKSGVSYRICRFPDLNDTWVWCHVIADGRMYAYTDQYLPCDARHNLPASDSAVYDAPGLNANITRHGTSADLESVSFAFDAMGYAGTGPHEGAGTAPIRVEGVFHPRRMHAQMQPGRFERIGDGALTLTVAGNTHRLSGVCKQHEQTQYAPRFQQSFTYCDAWSEHASLLGLLTARASGGDFEVEGQSTRVTKFAVAPPGPHRRLQVTLASGQVLSAKADAALDFAIPVYDRVWQGAMVSLSLGGRRMVGTLNDWKHEDQPYATDL